MGLGLNLNAPNEIFMTSISHTSTSFPQPRKIKILLQLSILLLFHTGRKGRGQKIKDIRASGLAQVRCLTTATAAFTLACLFVEMLCYVLGRIHSSCVLSTKIGLHR